jgi:4-hydroxy-4-methyl-2-oxoglutarate aldolase
MPYTAQFRKGPTAKKCGMRSSACGMTAKTASTLVLSVAKFLFNPNPEFRIGSAMAPHDPDVIAALKRFDTPTICNVLELFPDMVRTEGYLDARITACFPQLPPMVGYAVKPRGGDAYAGLEKQVEQIAAVPGPKVVVFQDLDDPAASATFGEVMCTTYQSFGCVGLITSGAGRDLDQVEALRFPCFTGGTIASHGYCQIVELDMPVRVGGVWINPGDLLHGDRNGVCVVPHPRAATVAAVCPEIAAAEAFVLDYVKSPNPTPAGFVHARRQCHAAIRAIEDRLKSHA